MKSFLLILVLFFTSLLAFSQEITWLNPLPQGNDLKSVYFLNVNTGFAIGDKGTILKTTDGGISWNRQEGITSDISKIFFTDNNTGYAICTYGLYKTSDGGSIWNRIYDNWLLYDSKLPFNHLIVDAYFPSSNIGYIVTGGCIIMKTTDGGINWIKQTSLPSYSIISVNFTDANTWHAVGAKGLIIKTTDGSINWTQQSSGTTNHLRSVCFSTSNIGYAVGDKGTILKTIDSGENWIVQNSGSTDYMHGAKFLDNNTGYVLGSEGSILKTIDGGTNWVKQTTNTQINLNSVSFLNTEVGYGVGENGAILKTINGGNSWASFSNGTYSDLNSVFFTDSKTGFAVGVSGTCLKTSDFGTNWTSQTLNSDLCSVYFPKADTGYIVGDKGAIYKTTDNGINWKTQISNTTFSIRSVHFPTTKTGYAVGDFGRFYKTVDGGENWIVKDIRDTTIGNNLKSVCFININTGYINDGNSLLKTIDGGLNWRKVLVDPSGYSALSFFFVDENTGYVTDGSNIWKTDNAGLTWIKGWNAFYHVNSFYFVDKKTGYAVSSDGAIFQTTDGGINWSVKMVGSNLSSIYFTSRDTGYAVGKYGAIIKYIAPNLSVSTNNIVISAKANSTKTFEINSNTAWAITSDQPWLKISKTSGSGNATITLTATENLTNAQRTANIMVSGTNIVWQSIAITQNIIGKDLDVSVYSFIIGAQANSTQTFDIISNVSWSVAKYQCDWLTVSSSGGSNNSTIIVTAIANPNKITRSGYIFILGSGVASHVINVTQEAAVPTLEVSANILTIGFQEKSTNTFNITSNVNWKVLSNQNWLTVSTPTGTNNLTMILAATANPTTATRMATITVSAIGLPNKTINVTQDGIPLFLSVSLNTFTIGASTNNSKTFDIISNINWEAASNQTWLTLSSVSGSGNATITLTAQSNPGTATRTATVTISGTGITDQTITVTQDGVASVLTVSTNSLTIGANSNSTQTFDISSNTNWTVASSQNWITISSPTGSSNLTVTLTATANPNTSTRTATVTVSGTGTGVEAKTIAITQYGFGVDLKVSTHALTLGTASGGSKTFEIVSNTDWTAISDQTWLNVDKASGNGNSTITLTAGANPGTTPRTATVKVSGTGVPDQLITLTQIDLTISTQDWQPQTSNATKNLKAVYFVNSTTGWSVGTSGTILKTTDAGLTWLPQTSGTTIELSQIKFFNENEGYASGTNILLLTKNGGTTWTSKTIDGSVYFSDINNGWKVKVANLLTNRGYTFDYKIYKTINAGDTWNEIFTQNKNISYDCFFSTNIRIVGRDNNIWVFGGYTNECDGYTAFALYSSDGTNFNNFNYHDGGNCVEIKNLFPIDQNKIWVSLNRFGASLCQSIDPCLKNTTNAGTGWTKLYDTGNPLNSLFVTSAKDAWFSIDKKIYLNNVNKYTSASTINGIYFESSGNGWAVGDNGTILKYGLTSGLELSTSALKLAAAANSTKTFGITSNTSWTISCDQTWLSANTASGSKNGTITVTAAANPGGESRIALVTVSGTGVTAQTIMVTQEAGATGIKDIHIKTISMFPNPVTHELTINNIAINSTILIYDLNGKQLLNKTAQSEIQKIDVSTLAKGVYSIIIRDKKEISTGKFVKE